MIGRISGVLLEKNPPQILVDVLTSLAAYTQAHFSDEERVMRLHNYPGYVAHKKAHDQLVSQVRNFRQEAETDKAVITLGLMMFLKNWLLEHIQREDAKYGPFLNAKGIA